MYNILELQAVKLYQYLVSISVFEIIWLGSEVIKPSLDKSNTVF